MQYCPNCDNALAIIRNSSDNEHKANFKCTNCEYTEPIMNHTLIISRSNEIDNSVEDTGKCKVNIYKNMVNDATVPHTRNYVCPNENCKSHKDFALRDAIWFKPRLHSYKKIFVCTACNQLF
jgi:predicted RNA-binding Zn-ribbon protein involved in translation (DUF1610 family)